MIAYLTYIPLDEGGYDPQGKYYGIGEALWSFISEDGEIDERFRAKSERAAFKQMKEEHPEVTIELGVSEDDVDAFTRGYIGAVKWLERRYDEDGTAEEDACETISPEALIEIELKPAPKNVSDLAARALKEQMGHDWAWPDKVHAASKSL